MSKKYLLQRPGFTESALVYMKYIRDNYDTDSQIKEQVIHFEQIYLDWLCYNSGYYDHSILPYPLPPSGFKGHWGWIRRGSAERFPPERFTTKEVYESISSSTTYTDWIGRYISSLKNSTHNACCLHGRVVGLISDINKSCFQGLLAHYNLHSRHDNLEGLSHGGQSEYRLNSNNSQYNDYSDPHHHSTIYDIISDKRILLVNGMASLLKQQFDNGNVYKIHRGFPRVKEVISYDTPYSFYNRGPHDNCISTLDAVFTDISKIEFDVCLLSYGAYAVPLAGKIFTNLNKSCIGLGHTLSYMFGVNPEVKNDKYWLSDIPKKYIPSHAKGIESGRYWYGS